MGWGGLNWRKDWPNSTPKETRLLLRGIDTGYGLYGFMDLLVNRQ